MDRTKRFYAYKWPVIVALMLAALLRAPIIWPEILYNFGAIKLLHTFQVDASTVLAASTSIVSEAPEATRAADFVSAQRLLARGATTLGETRLLGQSYLWLHDWEKADRLFESQRQKSDGDRLTLLWLGASRYARGNSLGAIEAWRDAGVSSFFYNLASTSYYDGHSETALHWHELGRDVEGPETADADAAYARYLAAWAKANWEDDKAAERALVLAIDVSGHAPAHVLDLVRFYTDRSKDEEAIAVLRAELFNRPEEPALHLRLGQILLDNGQPVQARIEAEAVLEQTCIPCTADAYSLLAAIDWAQGFSAAAIAEAEAAAEADGAMSRYIQLAGYLAEEGRVSEAINRLNEAIAAEMDATTAAWGLMMIGEIQMNEGALSAATYSYEKALNLAPDLWNTYYRLALAYDAGGRRADARSVLNEASTRFPDNPVLEQMLTSFEETDNPDSP